MARREVFYVETSEPAPRKSPVVQTGLVGWLRKNLFSSWWNGLLTVLSVALIMWAIVGAARWSIQQANWAVVINNLHLFAIGTYPRAQAWRPLVAMLALMFLVGLSWRLWGRAARPLVILAIAAVALLFVVPSLTANLPYPPVYTLVGGPTTDPIVPLAYPLQAGQTVTFTLQPVLDFLESSPTGFMDRASLTVSGLAEQEAAARQYAINRALAAGRTPPADVPPGAILNYSEEDGFTILERDLAATVTVYYAPATREENAETGEVTFTPGEPVAVQSFSAGPEPDPVEATLTAEETGWYLIAPERSGDIGAFWLETKGIAPLATTTSAVADRDARYGPAPDLNGRHQLIDTTTVPFRGVASFSDYAKLYLGPMASGLANTMLVLLLATAGGYLLGAILSSRAWIRRAMTFLWVVGSIAIFLLLIGMTGPQGALPVVTMERWGGLLLTMILTVVGIVAAFPIGVLLALGRRSELPVVRIFCTVSIETVRGVPLVTILFAASILVPLIDPSLSGVDNVIRAMIGIMFFSAAYLAEIVRGGLQAVPHGQAEAAKALGMSGWQITLLIILPQALRAVIPAIMGQFVSLFKDTSLVLIIGLLDLLGIARSVINQAEYIGRQRETLVFISVIYFVLSYLMSWASRRLEASGSGAVRRA